MRARGRLARNAILGAVAFALACGTSPEPPRGLHRLGADAAWRHCTLAGERRPAAPCAGLTLLARARDAVVPASGLLDVPLTPREGPALLVAEAFTYAEEPSNPLTLLGWPKLEQILGTITHHRGLERLIGRDPSFRRAPQPSARAATTPERVTLRFAPEDAGRRTAYAVWAWPVEPARRVLGPLTPAPGQRLRFAFGVREPAWDMGGPAVRFRVVAIDPATRRRTVLWRGTLDPARREGDRGWQEAEVDLGAAGEPRRLVLAARARGGASLPTWGRPALVDPRDAGRTRPSLILLSLDTLRADHVGAYGYARPTSPTLDALAARAVLFEQVIAPFPSTTASHMTMLTSLEPCAHGVLAPGTMLSANIPTVTERLAAAGYATAGITEDGLIKGDIGFERGFDTYRDLVPDPAIAPLGVFPDGIALARAWIERHAGEPYFLFLHTYQVHPPYKVPERHRGLFPVEADAPAAKSQEAEYDRGLRYTDDLVADFLRLLEPRGDRPAPVLLVTADHGIEFGEHGGIGHARGVYEEQIRVPLIVRQPGRDGGRRVRGQVGLIDLAPTLLALGGVTRPPSFAGRSLAPFLADGAEPPPVELVAEQIWGPRQTLLRAGHHAWIQKAGGLELYDLAADPRQQRNLAGEAPALASEGGRRIAEFRAECKRRQLALRAGPARAAPLDPERERTLRALGYVQ